MTRVVVDLALGMIENVEKLSNDIGTCDLGVETERGVER